MKLFCVHPKPLLYSKIAAFRRLLLCLYTVIIEDIIISDRMPYIDYIRPLSAYEFLVIHLLNNPGHMIQAHFMVLSFRLSAEPLQYFNA